MHEHNSNPATASPGSGGAKLGGAGQLPLHHPADDAVRLGALLQHDGRRLLVHRHPSAPPRHTDIRGGGRTLQDGRGQAGLGGNRPPAQPANGDSGIPPTLGEGGAGGRAQDYGVPHQYELECTPQAETLKIGVGSILFPGEMRVG